LSRPRRSSARGKSRPSGPAEAPAEAGKPPEATETSSIRRPGAVIVFLAVTAAALAADLVSKHVAFAVLGRGSPHRVEVIPGLLNLRLSTNPGIVFGITALPGWTVLAATAVAMVAVLVLFATSPPGRKVLHVALALILAGAAGNAYDRLFSDVNLPELGRRTGEVRDFIDLHVGSYHWPTFNLADVWLVVGVVAILVMTLLSRPERESP
jgi:signal peptidase II